MNIQLSLDCGQDLILFVLSSIGLTLLLVDSKIFYPVREFLKLIIRLPDRLIDFISYKLHREQYCFYFEEQADYFLKCYMCQGFWIGLLCSFFLLNDLTFYQWIACGFTSSFLSTLFGVGINYIKVLDFKAREKL